MKQNSVSKNQELHETEVRCTAPTEKSSDTSLDGVLMDDGIDKDIVVADARGNDKPVPSTADIDSIIKKKTVTLKCTELSSASSVVVVPDLTKVDTECVMEVVENSLNSTESCAQMSGQLSCTDNKKLEAKQKDKKDEAQKMRSQTAAVVNKESTVDGLQKSKTELRAERRAVQVSLR